MGTRRALILGGSGGVVLPYAPSGLAVATNFAVSGRLDLSWVDASSDETAFSIEQSANGTTGWTEVATPAADATSAAITGLTNDTIQYYRIRSNRSGTYSSYSSTASGTPRAQPSDVPTPSVWIDADDVAGTDGAAIQTWTSADTNAWAFTQADAAKRPLLKKAANGINGHNILRFDGLGDYFECASVSPGLTTVDNWTVFIVAKLNTDNATWRKIIYHQVVAENKSWWIGPDNGSDDIYANWYYSAGNANTNTYTTQVAFTAGAATRWRFNKNGLAYSIFKNGVSGAAVTLNTSALMAAEEAKPMAIGSEVGGTLTCGMDLAELIIYPTAISAGNITLIENYLAAKYGI